MKKIFYLLILFFVLAGCKKSEVTVEDIKEDKTPQVKVEEYLNDAKYLYIREINTNPNHPKYKSIALDTTEINKIYGFIKAVYELKVPQRDTVFNIHKIHIYGTIKLSDVTIFASDNGPGMQNLMNGIIPTGNAPLDSILHQYNLVKNSLYTLLDPNGAHYINLRTTRELNILALENKFRQIEGVIFPAPFGSAGDGNRISLSYQGNKAILDFSYGFGDCPAGCTGRTNWIFEVENNVAKFIERKNR
jgi:hypothetical protein